MKSRYLEGRDLDLDGIDRDVSHFAGPQRRDILT
jgi:hypothetical protein